MHSLAEGISHNIIFTLQKNDPVSVALSGILLKVFQERIAWPETMLYGCDQMAARDRRDLLQILEANIVYGPNNPPFGGGHVSERIVNQIREFLA